MRWFWAALAAAIGIGGLVAGQFAAPAAAQTAPCGIVDSIDLPIDISDSLRDGYDDFALFRPRFDGIHVGIDIAFNRLGDPVYAAARGRVTYSDVLGWDTEKGVVIIEHVFPDGSTAYTLYGHMEQTDAIFFPTVGECVERGEIVGVVGWPSRGLPHLHYEIRDFLPDDGGPGYVADNPLLVGWYHPLDFTMQWAVRLQPGFLDAVTYTDVPSLPPALIDSGVTVVSSGTTLAAFNAAGAALWRISTTGAITGVSALPGDRVAARARDGQTFVISASTGRYLAVWQVDGLDAPFLSSGETLTFLTGRGGLTAYDPFGAVLWTLDAPPAFDPDAPLSVIHFERGADGAIAFGLRGGGQILWRIVDASGAIRYETRFNTLPAFAALEDGGWLALDGATLYRISGGQQTELARIAPPAGRTARLTADIVGNVYIFAGDADNTLLSLDPHGGVRWRATYPAGRSSLSPLIDVGAGCTLYTLDADGMLNAFSTVTGELTGQRQLYAGGVRNGSPRARILNADASERVQVSAGFLSTLLLDGSALGQSCLLG